MLSVDVGGIFSRLTPLDIPTLLIYSLEYIDIYALGMSARRSATRSADLESSALTRVIFAL